MRRCASGGRCRDPQTLDDGTTHGKVDMTPAAAEPAPEDGNLPTALTELHDATNKLIGEPIHLAGRLDCPHCHNTTCEPDCTDHNCLGHPTPTTSLYMQLWDAVTAGRTGASQGTPRPRSMPTGWLDAQQLLDEIDFAVSLWHHGHHGLPLTVGRLQAVAAEKYRPQDVRGIQQKTAALKGWAEDIETLFNPPNVKTFSEPCPACGAKTAHRKDTAGEVVRVPALQIIADKGCTCMACHYTWGPELYTHLARVLGCKLPAGVLE